MNAINLVEEKIKGSPGIKYEIAGRSIGISPKDDKGFPVLFHEDGDVYTVCALGWHERFNNPSEALSCLMFLLSDKARLKVHKRGAFAYKFTLQYQRQAAWADESTVGLFIFPFWKKETVAFFQNAFNFI